jgi:Holliday junction resolvase RusA-like endonuclease
MSKEARRQETLTVDQFKAAQKGMPSEPPMRALEAIANQPRRTQTMRFTIPGKPIGAPRMTRRDKWAKRPCVVKYFNWRNALEPIRQKLPPVDKIMIFSWTATFVPAKKKDIERLAGHPHRAKPDRDNIDKALMDGLFSEDKGISLGTIQKVWGTEDRIDVEIVYEA